jgi:DTW domain-containing protein YfiP
LDTDVEKRRCFGCFRPLALCFCDRITQVDNRTMIWILQHRRERFHPFNTARIVARSLQRCRLIVDHNAALNSRFNDCQLSPRTGLLYPGVDSALLTQVDPGDLPDHLVILDGTWHHAKTLFREIPKLRTLPRYRLEPSSPGNYRIRREPNAHALSTLEATVAALRAIEPETRSLDGLVGAFEQMVDDQLTRTFTNRRSNSRRTVGARNIPRALIGDLSRIVVAYGEREKGQLQSDRSASKPKPKPLPVVWHARRLVTGETFECAIRSPSLQDDPFLQHLRLSPAILDAAISPVEFRDRWRAFVRPSDSVVVYHASTAALLDAVQANFCPQLILKSIKLDQRTSQLSLDRVLESKAIGPTWSGTSRAADRLAKAIAFVEYLNRIAAPATDEDDATSRPDHD